MYLDAVNTVDSYFSHIQTKSKSTQSSSKIALDWFDKFLLGKFGKPTTTVLEDLMSQKADHQKQSKNLFAILQDFINYLKIQETSPSTIREYFNLVKKYLNWYGFEVYSESVKSRLNFPQKIQDEEDYGLTLEDMKKIINGASANRRALYFFLSSTGMRIQETLKLRKRDLDFSCERTMIIIKGSYTKTKKPRKTFITKEAFWNLKPILKNKNDDDLIFTDNEDSEKAKHLEQTSFHLLRTKIGLDDRYTNGIHKITLHSFRSWFITQCNRYDSSFGHALAGHGRYMKKYVRETDSFRCGKYTKIEPYLSIFERVDVDQEQKIETQSKKILELEDKVNTLVTLYQLTKKLS